MCMLFQHSEHLKFSSDTNNHSFSHNVRADDQCIQWISRQECFWKPLSYFFFYYKIVHCIFISKGIVILLCMLYCPIALCLIYTYIHCDLFADTDHGYSANSPEVSFAWIFYILDFCNFNFFGSIYLLLWIKIPIFYKHIENTWFAVYLLWSMNSCLYSDNEKSSP